MRMPLSEGLVIACSPQQMPSHQLPSGKRTRRRDEERQVSGHRRQQKRDNKTRTDAQQAAKSQIRAFLPNASPWKTRREESRRETAKERQAG